jgi:exopolyphosphatase / guanosine-5'-triphosphate,3'-diphosphate pyrophosphatase
MTTITPRWEWRTFGQPGPEADRVFDAAGASAPAESDETYFLTGSGANVKIRDELVDIKLLRETDEHGLERWEPVLKRPFPLAAPDLATVADAMGIDAAAEVARGTDVGYDEFLAIVGRDANARIVPVHKRRIRYTIGACMAERSEIEADGHSTVTVAVESTDRPAVVAAVASLGYGDFLNMNYPSGLAWLLSGEPARYAVIDVGTNSTKFHVGSFGPDGTPETVVDRAEVTRLGEGLDADGRIQREPLDRAIDAFSGMADEAKRLGVRAIAAVGTEGLRQATNADEAIDEVWRRTGVRIKVVSGEDEGRLAYLAVRAGLPPADGSVVGFDTGGGSSQFSFGDRDHIVERFSVPVGAVRFTEAFGLDKAVSAETIDEAKGAIAADLNRLDGRASPDTLVGMGGAVTNITAVQHGLARYDPDVVQGSVLDVAELDRQIDLYRSRDADGRRGIVGLQPKRAEVILAGALVVRTVMDKLGKDRLTVSDRGLRHGLFVERFGPVEGTR